MITIVPAIDIIGGKCVRLTQGDYGKQRIYSASPLDVAKEFEDCGCSRIHIVDLDGARSNHIVNYKVLESIATHTSLKIDFGGGVKHNEDVYIAFESGAQMITGGSVAVKNQGLFISWIEQYGADKIILGADAKDGKISISGWGEDSMFDVVPFISEYAKRGVKKVISTDISSDGMLSGPSFSMYSDIQNEISDLFLIASGGVSNMDDIERLEELSIPEVIVGKAIYEGYITRADIINFNLKR